MDIKINQINNTSTIKYFIIILQTENIPIYSYKYQYVSTLYTSNFIFISVSSL